MKKGTDTMIAIKIIQGIIDDLTSRSGLGDAWDDIDVETQDEIYLEWREIAENCICGEEYDR